MIEIQRTSKGFMVTPCTPSGGCHHPGFTHRFQALAEMCGRRKSNSIPWTHHTDFQRLLMAAGYWEQ